MAWLERCLAGGALGLLLGGMAVSSWMQRGEVGLRERLQQFVAGVDAQELAIDHRHDAVWGETREGCALPCYRAAARLQKLASRFCWNDERDVAMADNQRLTGAELEARREQWRPVFAAVTEGAHCRDRQPLGGLDASMEFAWGLRAEVCARVADGETMSAVQLWLDMMTMHADVEPTGSYLGWTMAGSSIGVWNDDRLAILGAEARELLDAGLQRLERRVDVTPSPTGTIAAFLRPLLDGSRAREGWSLRERAWSWQSGMDPERRHLAGFAELVAASQSLLPPATTFAARHDQWTQFDAAPRPMSTYLSHHADERLRDLEKRRRFMLTSMRMLRIALAFHAGAAMPELADPFADAPLQVSGDEEHVLLLSAGGAKRYLHRVR